MIKLIWNRGLFMPSGVALKLPQTIDKSYLNRQMLLLIATSFTYALPVFTDWRLLPAY